MYCCQLWLCTLFTTEQNSLLPMSLNMIYSRVCGYMFVRGCDMLFYVCITYIRAISLPLYCV